MKKTFKIVAISIALMATIGMLLPDSILNNLLNAEICGEQIKVDAALNAATDAKKAGLVELGDSIEAMALAAKARGEAFIMSSFQYYTSSGGLSFGTSGYDSNFGPMTAINRTFIYDPAKWDPIALGYQITPGEIQQMVVKSDVTHTTAVTDASTQKTGTDWNGFYYDAANDKDRVAVNDNHQTIQLLEKGYCLVPENCECFTCEGGVGTDPNAEDPSN